MAAQSLHGFIYEIVDIPEHFEMGKLKDFCKKLVREIESVQSIKSPVYFENDFDDLEESQEKEMLKDDIVNKKESDEDENDVICSDFYEQKINSQPTFIFHLDTVSNDELTCSTLKLFDDIFQNVSYEIKSNKREEEATVECMISKEREEIKYNKPKRSKNKLTRRRIRKSFIHDQ